MVWSRYNSECKKSYRAKFFSLSDILFVLLIVISGFLFYHIINLEAQWILKTYLLIITTFFLFVPLLHFRLKYQFWQENKNKEYLFDPIERKILIIGEIFQEINLDDIEKITQFLPKNSKLASSYIKVYLKNEHNIVYLTPLLPCYEILMDFFEGGKKEIISKQIFGIY